MYVARLICSDPQCAHRSVMESDGLLDLLAAVCDCGCTLEILGLPDWVEDDAPAAPVLTLHRRRPHLPEAA